MLDSLTGSGTTDYIFFPATSIICPAISTIAGLCVLTAFFVGKSLREGALNIMILAINIADLIFSFTKTSTSIIKPMDEVHCKFLQSLSQGAIISSVLWGAFFGHALYAVSKFGNAEILSKYMKYYFIFGVFLPLGVALGLTFSEYVIYSPENDGVCIHRVRDDRMDYESIIFFIIPLTVGCVLSVVWYFMAARRIKSLFLEGDKGNLAMLIIYPGITLLCWVPMLIVNAHTLLGFVPSQSLVVTARALDQLQGFFDAIVYGGSIAVIRNTCKRACRRPLRKESLRKPLQGTDTESDESGRNTLRENEIIPRKVSLMPRKVSSLHLQTARHHTAY